ncbi:hypothetical protein GCM10023322_65320 [Rugosimonospora acidiphila]|uniref:Prenyltransferase n=1 Tax=Rugosimonospora acidiphila TaxID=556531 RepID=A0ABP9SHF7_9ACTN
MELNLESAASFMAGHARILDRHRFAALAADRGDSAEILSALDAYRNPDGGYGWGLEPDLRSAGSQPGAALHAFEAWAEVPAVPSPHSLELCDWLASITLPDGGLPFALPIADPAGCSPWWVAADPSVSSFQITAAVLANAHKVAKNDPAVAGHAWLRRATAYCLDAAASMTGTPSAYELCFGLKAVDAIVDTRPDALPALQRLARHLPASATMRVEGGTAEEALHPLDFSPEPHRPIRDLIAPDVIEADLNRLAGLQQPDGGWPVDFASASPAAALEWRGHMTVGAVALLRANGPC